MFYLQKFGALTLQTIKDTSKEHRYIFPKLLNKKYLMIELTKIKWQWCYLKTI